MDHKAYVAGPFSLPLLPIFRANSLLAIVKGEKVRPVLNISEPEGNSFNDCIDSSKLGKLKMDTVRTFSYKLREAGKGARMDKTDIQGAFKNVPPKLKELRLEGFQMNAIFFIELSNFQSQDRHLS
jgi:hypothetical protein